MKAEELRIGNIVLANNVNEQALEPHVIKDGTDIDNAMWYWGLPLSEEWMLKLGFFESKIRQGVYLKPIFGKFTIDSEDFLFDIKQGMHLVDLSDLIIHYGSEIKFVHELQNLYLALTGEELTIKD